MSDKTLYSFIAPEVEEIETKIVTQLIDLDYNRTFIEYNLGIDYHRPQLKINKFTNKKEFYIDRNKVDDLNDFIRIKNALICLGFKEGISL